MLSRREEWYLPRRFRPNDCEGSAEFTPRHRFEDRQYFTANDITLINGREVDYKKADERWREAYKERHVNDFTRRFLITLAVQLARRGQTSLVAEPFLISYKSSTPDNLCIKTLRTRAANLDAQGFLTRGKGGVESGVETAPLNRLCLYFTSYQKYRLLLACQRAHGESTRLRIGIGGQPLGGPE